MLAVCRGLCTNVTSSEGFLVFVLFYFDPFVLLLRSIAISVSTCLAYLKNHMCRLHEIFCTC